MDQRERWQALQSHLSAARASYDAGDCRGALQHVDAALAIDPDFLAALSLRDRLAAAPVAADQAPAVAPAAAPALAAPVPVPAPIESPPAEPERPLVSIEGYAQFEERAKRRRVDRRIDAARAAIAARRLKDAAVALNEIIELDPNLPDLTALTAEFDEMRRTTAAPHRGPWLAATATFVACVLGATWLQESHELVSRPTVAIAPIIEPLPATPIATNGILASTGDVIPDIAVPAPPPSEAPVRPAAAAAEPPRSATDTPARASAPVAQPAAAPDVAMARMTVPAEPAPAPATFQPIGIAAAPPPPPAVVPAAAPPVSAAPASAAADRVTPAVGSSAPVVDDDRLVRDALQRYRTAYEDLDAQSARAVWPAVNAGALARAFDGLESQTLTFDACTVQLRGDTAAAVCRGTARYVPKVGNRDPRVESRVWTFTLLKAAGAWTIQSARAQR